MGWMTEAAIGDLTRAVLTLAVGVESLRRDQAGNQSGETGAREEVARRFRSFDDFLLEEHRRRTGRGAPEE